MSISLNLVIFQKKDGELIEENLKTVKCEEITSSLLKRINSDFPLIKRKIYFDESLKDSFEIECFSSSDIDNICNLLEEMFLELLRYENNWLYNGRSELTDQDSKSEELVIDIIPDTNNNHNTELAIARFRILTGISGIFTDMKNRFSDDVGAIIKLG